MKPMQSYFAVCLAVVTFCAVTCDVLVSETANDTLALAHCVHLIEPVPLDSKPYTYQKTEYRNHNCSLVCEYLEDVQHVPFCGGRGGGCFATWTQEQRVRTINLNEGQPCESKGICHNGHCTGADSNRGNLTAILNSKLALNDQFYTKHPFAKCNTSVVEAGDSAIVLCIDSQHRNVSTLTEMSGFTLNWPFGPFGTHEHGTRPAEMCDLLYCFEWIPTLTETPHTLECHYGSQFLSTSDNINFLFTRSLILQSDDCILDVIQLPLSELVQDHGKRSERVLQFAHIDVPLNVTLEWTKIIP